MSLLCRFASYLYLLHFLLENVIKVYTFENLQQAKMSRLYPTMGGHFLINHIDFCQASRPELYWGHYRILLSCRPVVCKCQLGMPTSGRGLPIIACTSIRRTSLEFSYLDFYLQRRFRYDIKQGLSFLVCIWWQVASSTGVLLVLWDLQLQK